MSKKHFVALAAALRASKPEPVDAAGTKVWENVIVEVTFTVQGFNPAFDRERFLTACGVESK